MRSAGCNFQQSLLRPPVIPPKWPIKIDAFILSLLVVVAGGEIAVRNVEDSLTATSVGSFELLQLLSSYSYTTSLLTTRYATCDITIDVNMQCFATSHRSWVAILASLRLVAALDVESFALPGSWTPPSGKARDISGFAPTSAAADSEKFPVFVWLTGTGMSYWTEDDQVYTQEMAERGFVAASVKYPSRPYPGQCGEFWWDIIIFVIFDVLCMRGEL